MRNTKAFTLIELMVVILIVGILAAASVPLMRGRVDSAKWAEANATAGTIRSAARVYFAEHGSVPTGDIDSTIMAQLGFNPGDLNGTYFIFSDYNIGYTDDGSGNVSVTVKGTQTNAPSGTKTLSQDGKTWQ